MLSFAFPELFLLAVPLGFAYWRWGRAEGVTGGVRVAMLLILLLALTGARINLGGRGIDVVIVADRSRSLPSGADGRIRELIQNVQHARHGGDRVAVVTFGSSAALESRLSEESVLSDFKQQVLPDGSDLDDALHVALDLVTPNRPARILVFSDGESNGPDPASAARRARDAGVPVDYREFPRLRVGDIAVDSLLLPETVAPREPFQYAVWIYADREAAGRVSVLRDGKVISQDESDRQIPPGMSRLLFRDLLEQGGMHNFEVRVDVPGDPLPENNRGAGVVRVDAGPRLLVLNADGQDDNFVRALRAGNIAVDVAASRLHSLTQDSLDRYRGVVLENVPAADLGRLKMERLAQFVEDLGGGLMLTGGERSFGTGGYFKSPLDEVLPVSMEMRDEHRKMRLALAIALDRSGSMTAPVKGGKQKMDLANLGTAECVRLLSPGDSVAVIAVDSAPHVVQELTNVDDPDAIAAQVLGIQSQGGGIFVYEALVAAGEQVMKAEQTTRHIILFSDAADSEEPGDYATLLGQFERAGITVSVIGLGEKTDRDAALLEDIAKLGKGNILFTADAEELPRLFAQETMSVARSSFIRKDAKTQPAGIAGKALSGARLMGELPTGSFPLTDGYNLSYLKPQASVAVVSQDEYAAPWDAFWYRGLGRVAALTLEVDGQHSGAFGRWNDYASFAVTHARWLLGGDRSDEAFLTLNREGQEAVMTLELDPDRPAKAMGEAPALSIVSPGDEREPAVDVPFQWRGPNTLQARFKLTKSGTYRSLVKLGDRKIIRGPAVTLPYSPEYVPRAGLPSGAAVLKGLAALTGGKARIDVVDVLSDPPRSARMASLLPFLLSAGIVLLLVEIAGRRLSLWSRLSDALEVGAPAAGAVTPSPRRQWFSHLRFPLRGAKPAAGAAPPSPAAAPPPGPTGAPTATPSAPVPAPSAASIYEQAKRRARRRLNE